jgi:hypothetical protein
MFFFYLNFFKLILDFLFAGFFQIVLENEKNKEKVNCFIYEIRW